MTESRRVILFLQGPPSTFWRELASTFERRGHRTVKINVCFGDAYFWRRRGAYSYRGLFRHWPAYLERIISQEGVTDIVYYADRQPYHVEAQAIAGRLGLKCYAVEFGYLRPHWLTLERGGMGTYSHFPSDPDHIRRAAKGLPEVASGSPDYPHGFVEEAYGEVAFHLFSEFLRPLYPFYRSDRYYHAFHDYLSWLVELTRGRRHSRQAKATLDRLAAASTPYFLVALQLQSDYQIRANSPYIHIRDMLDEVISSFAGHARPTDHLVIKQHPLDNGWENWEKVVRRLARRYGVCDRVHLIVGGRLPELISAARGVVVINSTVGLHALQAGCPTKILGIAVFDIAGLTDQQPLDRFWQDPAPVDMALLADFRRLLAKTVQLRGSFYNRAGRAVAANEIVSRIERGEVNEPGGYVEVPPRLISARRLGVRLCKKTAKKDRALASDNLVDSSPEPDAPDALQKSRNEFQLE